MEDRLTEERLTQDEVIDSFIGRGILTAEQAESIRYAPRWSITIRELVMYLGSLIVVAGVVRLIAVIFEDASRWTVCAALYFAAVLFTSGSLFVRNKSAILNRLSEVLEVLAVLSAALATAIPLDEADMRGEWIASILFGAVVIWGAFRVMRSMFCGTVFLVVGLMGVASSLSEGFRNDTFNIFGVLVLVSAAIHLWLGTAEIGMAMLSRAAGALFVVIGSTAFAQEFDNKLLFFPAITGGLLFALGALELEPVYLFAGALCVLIGVISMVVENIDNEVAQGIVIIATGLAVLGVLSIQVRKAVNRPTPGIPTA